MTKPETEWVLAKRELLERVAALVGNHPVIYEVQELLSASPPAPSVPDVVLIDGVPYDRADLPKMVTELTRKWEDACTDAELYRDIESSSRRLLADIGKVLDADPEDNLVMLIEGRLDEIKSYEEEATVTELRAEVLGVREEYALCRTLLMERTAEVERLTGERDLALSLLAGSTAGLKETESSLETAKGALVETEKHLWWAWAPPWKQKEAPPYLKRVELLELVREALAALQSPPITKTDN